MPQETTHTERWRKHLSNNGRAVEERIEALRAKNRLAIHVIENIDQDKLYPDRTRGYLRHNKAFLSATRKSPLENGDIALLSMTLLPRAELVKSITPYSEKNPSGIEIAYLMNLDESLPAPARVVRVFEKNGNTGASHFQKMYRLNEQYATQAMHEFYEPYAQMLGHNRVKQMTLLNDVFRNPTLSGRQLDILADYYKAKDSQPSAHGHNEVLAAAAPQHLEAIVIPLREASKYVPAPVKTEVIKFMAALSGIEHARKGRDLPVMVYHVVPPNQGQCSYVAQGEEECREAAFNAVRAIAKINENYLGAINEPMRQNGKRLLGVDVYWPLEEQGIVSFRQHSK